MNRPVKALSACMAAFFSLSLNSCHYGAGASPGLVVNGVPVYGTITDEAAMYLEDLKVMDAVLAKRCKALVFTTDLPDDVLGQALVNGTIRLHSFSYDPQRLLHELYHLEDSVACGDDYCSDAPGFDDEVRKFHETRGLTDYQMSTRREAYAAMRLAGWGQSGD